MHDMVLEGEPEVIAARLDQPVVVPPADPWTLDAIALLFCARGGLDVPGLGHPKELGAYPNRIAHVLEGVRAHDEVEPAVGKRPWRTVADVTLHPGCRREVLGSLSIGPELASSRVRVPVQDDVGPAKWPGPSTDIEDRGVFVDQVHDPFDAFGDQLDSVPESLALFRGP